MDVAGSTTTTTTTIKHDTPKPDHSVLASALDSE
jgi:hypothetical protein